MHDSTIAQQGKASQSLKSTRVWSVTSGTCRNLFLAATWGSRNISTGTSTEFSPTMDKGVGSFMDKLISKVPNKRLNHLTAQHSQIPAVLNRSVRELCCSTCQQGRGPRALAILEMISILEIKAHDRMQLCLAETGDQGLILCIGKTGLA